VTGATMTATPPGWTPALVMRNALALGANALQVYGVLYWGWDTFQILMLYWMETAVIGFWALVRLAFLPENLLGEMTVNGRVVAATNKLLLQLFVPFVAISMALHLLILWVMFSGDWSKVVHGPVSFAAVFIVASGAWAPLLFTLFAGAAGFYESPKRISFLSAGRTRIDSSPPLSVGAADKQPDDVGAAIGGTLGRIVVMQVAVILGGMLARKFGTTAPWLILIGLKTLLDIERPQREMAPARQALS
jgi:Family of unknown function (DUF6498)